MSRPEYQPSDQDRERVAIWRAGGMAKEAIALALGIDAKTLDKHFEYELAVVAAKKRGEMIESLSRAGRRGNVAAQKAFLALGDLNPPTPPRTDGEGAPAPAPDAPAAKPLGKKETRLIEASTAAEHTSWDEIVRH